MKPILVTLRDAQRISSEISESFEESLQYLSNNFKKHMEKQEFRRQKNFWNLWCSKRNSLKFEELTGSSAGKTQTSRAFFKYRESSLNSKKVPHTSRKFSEFRGNLKELQRSSPRFEGPNLAKATRISRIFIEPARTSGKFSELQGNFTIFRELAGTRRIFTILKGNYSICR